MESPVSTDVHGHEVMRMMLASGESYDAASLERAIIARFGPETRYCTCSASGMTAGELIAFLATRGKFVPAGEGFTTEAGKICDH